MTLADAYLADGTGNPITALYDAPTGRQIDDPLDAYEIVGEYVVGEYTWRAVRGPSGELDVEGPHAGFLNRNVLADPDELAAWVEANYRPTAWDKIFAEKLVPRPGDPNVEPEIEINGDDLLF